MNSAAPWSQLHRDGSALRGAERRQVAGTVAVPAVVGTRRRRPRHQHRSRHGRLVAYRTTRRHRRSSGPASSSPTAPPTSTRSAGSTTSAVVIWRPCRTTTSTGRPGRRRARQVRPVPGDPGLRLLGARARHHDAARPADRRRRRCGGDRAGRGGELDRLHRRQEGRPASTGRASRSISPDRSPVEIHVAINGRANRVEHLDHPDVTLTTDSTTFIQLACGRIDPAGPDRLGCGQLDRRRRTR